MHLNANADKSVESSAGSLNFLSNSGGQLSGGCGQYLARPI